MVKINNRQIKLAPYNEERGAFNLYLYPLCNGI